MITFIKRNRDRPFLAYFPMALCHDVTDDLEAPVPHGPLDRYDSFSEMVHEMDRSVGRLVAALDALQLRERTLILFLGDNGTPQRMIVRAEDGNLVREPVVSQRDGSDIPGGKGTLNDTGTRVPLIANWLGTVQPGQVVDDLVDMSDFWPTLMELAAVDSKQEVDGLSFACRLVENRPAPRRWAFSTGRGDAHWVRTATWKLYGDGRLFDMSADMLETCPLLVEDDTAEQARVRSQLLAALRQVLRGQEVAPE